MIDGKETANIMNDYFASVFTEENLDNIPKTVEMFTSCKSDALSKIDIDEGSVFKYLDSINVNKSLGPDEIHGKIIYELRHELVGPLTRLFNLSLNSGYIPQDWKNANVIPLFKKGSKQKPENYRPVSLTSVVGKILESIIKERLLEHLHKFRLIRDSQHGFTSGRSCLTNLIDFLNQ